MVLPVTLMRFQSHLVGLLISLQQIFNRRLSRGSAGVDSAAAHNLSRFSFDAHGGPSFPATVWRGFLHFPDLKADDADIVLYFQLGTERLGKVAEILEDFAAHLLVRQQGSAALPP